MRILTKIAVNKWSITQIWYNEDGKEATRVYHNQKIKCIRYIIFSLTFYLLHLI